MEKSFVAACQSLAGGYVDELKLFIATGKAGYKQGMTIPQLQLELTACPSQSAGRPLAQEEVRKMDGCLFVAFFPPLITPAHTHRPISARCGSPWYT